MRTRSGLLVVCVIAAFLMSSISAFSQVTTAQAQLNGSVRDQSGGAIVKASITLRDVDTNRVSTAVSNDVGYYILPNLPPGRLCGNEIGTQKKSARNKQRASRQILSSCRAE